MTQPDTNIVTLSDVKRLMAEKIAAKDAEWMKVVRELTEEKGDYEDIILTLQQSCGLPLSLDVPKRERS